MDTHELLEKISIVPLVSNKISRELLAGNFSSIFKGQGIEFDEVRHYQWGDDARSIDWNASARLGTPFVKVYREERDLTILLLLDVSASMRNFAGPDAHAPTAVSPYEQGLMTAATLAFSAERSGQRMGALLFDCGIEKIFPPRKGRHHTMAFISGALQYQCAAPDNMPRKAHNERSGSNLGEALRGAARILGKRSMVVVISDFLCAAWEQEFASICRKHDMLAIRIKSHIGGKLPDWGLVTMEDPETSHRVTAPTRFRSFRDAWSTWHKQQAEFWSTACRRYGAAQLELSTDVDASESLYKFFSARSGSRKMGNRE
jgi:uncharacterized protein (DUF58 family)